MPGCTVPYCFNSTNKGFRLYHFPADKDRKEKWASNIGREAGWNPTLHTCVCEIHFEESQFESHRADGLRKLKPNAVPTIFNETIRRIKRKRKQDIEVLQNDEVYVSDPLEIAGHTYQKRRKRVIVKVNTRCSEDEDDPLQVEEVCLPSSSVLEKVGNTKKTKKKKELPRNKTKTGGKKKGKTKEETSKEETYRYVDEQEKSKAEARRWRRKPDMNASRMYTPIAEVNENNDEVKRKTKDKTSQPMENTVASKEVKCFMCNKETKKMVSLKTRTKTTKIEMIEKLVRTLSDSRTISIQEEENVLCPRCAQLLNYVDRIEMELTMLNKAISNSILKSEKVIEVPQPRQSQKSSEKPTESRQPGGGRVTQVQEGDYSWLKAPEAQTSPQNKLGTKVTKSVSTFTDDIPRRHKCRICNFQTQYSSVMVFHLRQHLKRDSKRCDFCNHYLKMEDHAFQNKDYEKECQQLQEKNMSQNNDSNNDVHLLISKNKNFNSTKIANKNITDLSKNPRTEYITESLEKAGVIAPRKTQVLPTTVQLLPVELPEVQVLSPESQHNNLENFSDSRANENFSAAEFNLGSSVIETGTLVLENVPLSEDSTCDNTSSILLTIAHPDGREEVAFLPSTQLITTENDQNFATEEDTPQFINISEGFMSIVPDVDTAGTDTVSFYENVTNDVTSETQSLILNNVLVPENASYQQNNISTETEEGTAFLMFENVTDSSTFNDEDNNCENSQEVQVLNNIEAILIKKIASAPELTPVIEQLTQETMTSKIDKYPENSSAADMPDIEMLAADPAEESFDVSNDESLLAEELNLPPLAESPSNEVIDIIIADEAVLDGSVLQLSQ